MKRLANIVALLRTLLAELEAELAEDSARGSPRDVCTKTRDELAKKKAQAALERRGLV